MSFTLTIEQYNDFMEWFVDELDEGANDFNYVHPWLQQNFKWVITTSPQASNLDALGVSLNLSLEYY